MLTRTTSYNAGMREPPDVAPRFVRFSWPKIAPPLSDEGRQISDDFMRHWHEVLPQRYGAVERFNHRYALRLMPAARPFRTIEIGAGIGEHLRWEDLSVQDYHCIELRENMTAEIRRRFPGVTATTADCQTRLPYPDEHFDRAIAIHVLEHLPDLPGAAAELRRVLRPGAIFSIVIPCDPGAAYAVARKISAERIFRRRYRMPYDWLIRREHINSPDEIVAVMRDGFDEIDRTYFPLRVPLVSANLCIGVTYRRST